MRWLQIFIVHRSWETLFSLVYLHFSISLIPIREFIVLNVSDFSMWRVTLNRNFTKNVSNARISAKDHKDAVVGGDKNDYIRKNYFRENWWWQTMALVPLSKLILSFAVPFCFNSLLNHIAQWCFILKYKQISGHSVDIKLKLCK